MANRRKQVVFRLGVCAVTALLYGPLVGWPGTLGWATVYALLQAIEDLCLHGRRPWFPRFERGGQAAALTLLSLNSTVFGAFALIESISLGLWGEVTASYLLAGSILNTVLTTIGCRQAFTASLLPFVGYIMLVPLRTFCMAERPPGLILLGIGTAGILLALGGIKLWKEWSQAKAAEFTAIARDIAERQANEQRLFHLAHVDTLTGLGNRVALQSKLAELVGASGIGALLMVDLDGFKYVNDTLGHSAGDQVLQEVAVRIGGSARDSDSVTRLGGDEFAVLLHEVPGSAMAAQVADRIISSLSVPVVVGGQPVNIGASVGIAMYPSDGANAEELLSNADLALYKAKADGRHCSRFYNPGLRVEARRKLSRDNEFVAAIEGHEFELFYQPQIRLRDGAVVGAEALLRWRHPERGLLLPGTFLLELESGRLAAQVGDWVVETACLQAATWRQHAAPDFRVGVNLFGAQFRSGNLADKVVKALSMASLPPHALELEITENVILRHEDEMVAPLRELRAHGVGVAFDDYGTGYASLSLLKRYPLSRLKIDQSFTVSMCESASDNAIVRAIISMARAFDLEVIAEGVETRTQAELLNRNGCNEVQGYLFGAPMSVADFTAWMARRRARLTIVPAFARSQPDG